MKEYYDLIISNGFILDTRNLKIFTAHICINNGIIEKLLPLEASLPKTNEVIDASGKYISPGFIDSHIHIESSMLSPMEFSAIASSHGTTTILADPHEIANVCGLAGIEWFLNQAKNVPLDLFIGIPSCVPATHLEHSGSTITLKDITKLMKHPGIFGLAEMMNFPGIINDIGDARSKVDAVYNYGKLVDGHAPGLSGKDLLSYISNGNNDGIVRIMTDHECTTSDEAIEKLNAGMNIAIRYGSATRDLDAILPGLLEKHIDLKHCMLCSDDLSPSELLEDGHVDRIINRALMLMMSYGGYSLEEATIKAISLATFNPSQYLKRFYDVQDLPYTGEIAEGYAANIIILDSLEELHPSTVLIHGKHILDTTTIVEHQELLETVNVGKSLTPQDFFIGKDTKTASINVIESIPGSLRTKHKIMEVSDLCADPSSDLAKIAVFERHNATGHHTIGFISKLGLKSGALATTIAHDSHNLIVAGVNDEDMACAANALIECGGGMAVVNNDVVDVLPLEIGGLISTKNTSEVAQDYKNIKTSARKLGTSIENIFMTLSFMALPVIPSLKITDVELIDVDNFTSIPLIH